MYMTVSLFPVHVHGIIIIPASTNKACLPACLSCVPEAQAINRSWPPQQHLPGNAAGLLQHLFTTTSCLFLPDRPPSRSCLSPPSRRQSSAAPLPHPARRTSDVVDHLLFLLSGPNTYLHLGPRPPLSSRYYLTVLRPGLLQLPLVDVLVHPVHHPQSANSLDPSPSIPEALAARNYHHTTTHN